MRDSAKNALAFIIPLFFAVICIGVSLAVMNGYQDCSIFPEIDFFPHPPGPDNCADDRTLLTRDVFWFLGIILLFAPLAATIIMWWRKEYDEEIKLESIKISEL
jgi:hypothetical protein